MSNTINGWPGKPGVPLNAEKDGWHWLKTPDGHEVPYEWRAAGECERGHWPDYWALVHDDNSQAMQCTYLAPYVAPCLTPDEAAALQAKNARLKEVLQQTVTLFQEILDALNADPAETKLTLRKEGVEVQSITAADCFKSARAELEQNPAEAQAAK